MSKMPLELAVTTGVSVQMMEFIQSLPSDTNVYSALIPFINANAAPRNPRWMSIVLIFFIISHFVSCIFSTMLIIYQLKRGKFWLLQVPKFGFIKPNRILTDGIAIWIYSVVTIIGLSCQLYIDFRHVPVRGKLILSGIGLPIGHYSYSCMVWIYYTRSIRRYYGDNLSSGNPMMPKWIPIFGNLIFVIYAIGTVIILLSMLVHPTIIHTQIVNTTGDVVKGLRSASQAPDAIPYSEINLRDILSPLRAIPPQMDRLGALLKTNIIVANCIFLTLIIAYIGYIVLVHREYKTYVQIQRSLSNQKNQDQHARIDYQAELGILYLESVLAFVMICSHLPVFIWVMIKPSNRNVMLSKATTMVLELTLTLITTLLLPIFTYQRVISSKRLLACKVAENETNMIESEFQEKKSFGKDQIFKIGTFNRISFSKISKTSKDEIEITGHAL
ncbi:uncharacterized protein MELLADRAFT_70502 [Melampsora larici-populina 98AG31]|uniref:Uncharacterized protein n=1 Tax=Melampsora larici-populina (strain 98AG31 / pathotype 3-4-7) TaxID=747676 RepID=F4R4G2_MELLP|nr:uncharacterized protein MELLADRAFT_70502 [Melampsora larici-populina 98AG31]EGG12804.1 hypothetical protein MELLADRAFT_70502 [Melampsora larici-populina 98AG31]